MLAMRIFRSINVTHEMVEQEFVRDQEIVVIPERDLHQRTSRIVDYRPMVGNFSIDVPKIVETTGKAAAYIGLGNIVTAAADSLLNASDTRVRGIEKDKVNRYNKVTRMCFLHILPPGAARKRGFNNEVAVGFQENRGLSIELLAGRELS